jgi:hypothetical protein
MVFGYAAGSRVPTFTWVPEIARFFGIVIRMFFTDPPGKRPSSADLEAGAQVG